MCSVGDSPATKGIYYMQSKGWGKLSLGREGNLCRGAASG